MKLMMMGMAIFCLSLFYGIKLMSQQVGNKFKEGKLYYRITALSPVKTVSLVSRDENVGWDEATLVGKLEIPSKVIHQGENYTVTVVGALAFAGCKKLTTVSIPNTVKRLEDESFADCTALQSILIAEQVEHIGNAVFEGCSELREVAIPKSAVKLGNNLFGDCKKLSKITVSKDNVHYASIGGVLFNKKKTVLLSYPQGKAVSSYVVPDFVTTIAADAFANCDRLSEIILPNSIKKIGENSFYSCVNLSSITLPPLLREIGSYAFYECTTLKLIVSEIVNLETVSMGKGVFYDVDTSTCVLYVPKGKKDAYSDANQWADFFYIVEK